MEDKIASLGNNVNSTFLKDVKAVAEKWAQEHGQTIIFEVENNTAWVTLNRPESRNAFREHILDVLGEAR